MYNCTIYSRPSIIETPQARVVRIFEMFGYSKYVILNGVLISHLFNAQQNSNEYHYNSKKNGVRIRVYCTIKMKQLFWMQHSIAMNV